MFTREDGTAGRALRVLIVSRALFSGALLSGALWLGGSLWLGAAARADGPGQAGGPPRLLSPAHRVEVASRHQVTVFRSASASIIDLEAEGPIDAPPGRVQALLLDYPTHTRFVRGLVESRVLRRAERSLVVYQRLRLPWLSDRDFTLEVRWGETARVPWLAFRCRNELGPPPRAGAVRIEVHEGGWLLNPRNGGRGTWARYHFRLDLSGSLPRWMSRGRAGREVPRLFQAIRKQLQ